MRRFALLWALGLTAIIAAPASARLWKPSSQQLAADYATIMHNKGTAGGRVTIQWIAGPGTTRGLQQTLDKYVVIAVSHVMQNPTGLSEWLDVDGVQVTDANGQALKEIAPDAIVPTLVGFISGVQATQRQSTQGKGKMKILVFEPGPVQSCVKGGLVVVYEGE